MTEQPDQPDWGQLPFSTTPEMWRVFTRVGGELVSLRVWVERHVLADFAIRTGLAVQAAFDRLGHDVLRWATQPANVVPEGVVNFVSFQGARQVPYVLVRTGVHLLLSLPPNRYGPDGRAEVFATAPHVAREPGRPGRIARPRPGERLLQKWMP